MLLLSSSSVVFACAISPSPGRNRFKRTSPITRPIHPSLRPLTTYPRRQRIVRPTRLPLRIPYSLTIRNQRTRARLIQPPNPSITQRRIFHFLTIRRNDHGCRVDLQFVGDWCSVRDCGCADGVGGAGVAGAVVWGRAFGGVGVGEPGCYGGAGGVGVLLEVDGDGGVWGGGGGWGHWWWR